LAASVHHTYPGFNIKYRPLHGAFQDCLSFPTPIYYPNGTADVSGYPKGTDVNEFTTPVPQAAALNNRLRQAAKLGPTIFPILFAGTVGSTLKLLARWRAEKGSSIEVKP
jgi:hypothetical protein